MKHRKPLSRNFPKHHPRAGQQTFFVEQIYNSLFEKEGDWSNAPGDASAYVVELNHFIEGLKHHTVRGGNRVKVGDLLQFYVWSGKPYRSKQINVTEYFEVKKTFDFVIDMLGGEYRMNGVEIPIEKLRLIALNDGFTDLDDFECWFKLKKGEGFIGQIICWNENVSY